jgi:AraC family transcriptional regulator of arabinose operon
VEGQCKVYLHGQWQMMTSGDLLLFRPGEVTEFWFDPNYEKSEEACNSNYCIFCQGSWIESWWNAKNRQSKVKVTLSESLLAIFKEIVLEQNRNKDCGDEVSEYLLRTLCIYIDRAEDPSPYRSKHQLETANQMKSFIGQLRA